MLKKDISLIVVFLIVSFFFAPVVNAQTYNREQEAFFVAKKAYEDGFYEVSLNLFQRFANNYSSSLKIPEASLYIAQCYFQQGKFVTALSLFEKLASDPSAKDLRDTVFYWIGEVYFRGRDFKKAISFYQKIIEEFPKSRFIVHSYYSRGWCLFEIKEFEEAFKNFQKVISDFPSDSLVLEACFKSLECLYNLKNYEALGKEILVFKNRYPENTIYAAQISYLLAECSFYTQEYNKAIQEYQSAIGISSKNNKKITMLSQLGIAWCCLKLKNYNEVYNVLENIEETGLANTDKEGLLLVKVNLFTETKDFKKALDIWSELAKTADGGVTKMQAYLGKAEMLYNLGKYSEAISVYNEAKGILLSSPSQLLDKLYYGLAWAHLKNGQFRDAIVEFQKAASFASDDIIKIAALCQVGDTYQDAEDYQKAIEVYDQILNDYPDSFYVDYVQYQLGLGYLRLKQYNEAVIAFRTLLLNFPKSKLKCETIYSLALALFQKQDYRGSQEIINRYISDLNNCELKSQMLYLLATSLYNLGDFAEAMNVFNQLISSSNDIKIIQKAEYEIADCFYQIGNETEAIKRFKILRAKYSDSALGPEVTWWLGGYYFRKGDIKLSRRYFSSLIEDFPESGLLADGYYALGLLDQEEGDLESAVKNLNKAKEIGTKDVKVQAIIAIADILSIENKFSEAEDIYRLAIKESPALAGFIYPKISYIYEKKGEFDQAIQFYLHALSLVSMKDAPQLQFKIAHIFEKKGDYNQAVEEYLKIPYLYPGDSQLVVKAYLSGAQIYENQENWLSAKDIYLKVVSMDVEEAKYARERISWIEGINKLNNKE